MGGWFVARRRRWRSIDVSLLLAAPHETHTRGMRDDWDRSMEIIEVSKTVPAFPLDEGPVLF